MVHLLPTRRARLRAPYWLCLAAGLPLAATAQTQLAPIVVTGTRTPTPLDRMVGDLVVIDAERIRESNADSVEDLLRRQGGIQMTRNGGPGQNAGVQIRGANVNQTVFLIDGVRVGSASLGQFALENLSLAQIERIEILRGPGSSLYGADAVGGVVQIFTRRGEAAAPRIGAHVAAGSRHSSEGDFSASGATGAFDYAAGIGRESSRGVSAIKPGDRFGLFNPDSDGFRRDSARFAGGVRLAEGHRLGVNVLTSRLRSQYDSADFAPPAFAADPSPDFRNRGTSRLAAVDYRAVLSPQWTGSVQLSKQDDDLLSGASTLSRFDTQRRQLTAQAAWTPVAGQNAVAAFERIIEELETGAYSAPKRGNSAFVLGYSGRFGAHQLQADMRHDERYGVGTGKLGWSLQAGRGWTLRAVAGNAFRAPSFNELYFPSFGVSTLSPEKSRSVEVGAAWAGSDASAGVTLYRNRVRDLIVAESDPAACPGPAYAFGCARNVARARLQGATVSASKRVGRLDLRAAARFSRCHRWGDRHTPAAPRGAPADDRRRLARWRLALGCDVARRGCTARGRCAAGGLPDARPARALPLGAALAGRGTGAQRRRSPLRAGARLPVGRPPAVRGSAL